MIIILMNLSNYMLHNGIPGSDATSQDPWFLVQSRTCVTVGVELLFSSCMYEFPISFLPTRLSSRLYSKSLTFLCILSMCIVLQNIAEQCMCVYLTKNNIITIANFF